MLNEQDVERIDEVVGTGGFEKFVGLVGGGFGGDEGETFGDAMDMGVDGEGGLVEVEHQDAGDGFGADAVESGQVGAGLVEGAAGEEV